MELPVATLPITEDEARALVKARKERKAKKRKVGPLDRAQQALAKAFLDGEHIVHLGDVIRAAGQYENGTPKLAAARTGWGAVMFTGEDVSQFQSQGPGRPLAFGAALIDRAKITKPDKKAPSVWMPFGGGDEANAAEETHIAWHSATVPVIPDRVEVPKAKKGAERVILFETAWTRVPQPDPALLERITGPWWKVIATWDLTALEADILGKMAYEG